jgi:hypothetical protein
VPIRPETIRSQGIERDEYDVAAGTRREVSACPGAATNSVAARRTIRYGSDHRSTAAPLSTQPAERVHVARSIAERSSIIEIR